MPGLDAWLTELGLGQYAEVFAQNDIDLDVLVELSEPELAALGLSLGHRKRLLKALRARAQSAAPATRAAVAERRQLTVLFCDLVGSTELSGRLDPEDLREVIRSYHDCVASVIGGFEGYVARFTGDGALAWFGYPKAHEDAAERAVRAGLQLVDAIGTLHPLPEVALQARIGIATGLVVVGDLIGPGVEDRDAVVGETPNLAARLQAVAQPGAVVVATSTHRLVQGAFEFADAGEHQLKGFAQPVHAWQVLRVSAAEGRFAARQTAGLTSLVGRGEELNLLLRRWQRAKQGQGQIVLLSGEPGVGKSRLAQALRDALRHEPQVTLRFFCSPFYAKSALHPVLEQLERAAGIQRNDLPEVKLEKLKGLLGRATGRVQEATAVLAPLLSIPTDEGAPQLDLTPQQRKAKAFEILNEQLLGLAEHQPVLLIVDDMQWMDPSSLELFHRVLERVPHLPVMALLIFRPEFRAPWADRPDVTRLELMRLSHRQAAALAERVAGKPLPWNVLEQIVARTDGVPLFVEELTKTILESGLLEDAGDRYVLQGPLPELAIPASLHDSLMARLDRLAPVKELAQLAATLGRIFTHELLEAVSPLKDPVLSEGLAQLIEAELLYRRGSPPNATYDFKHALIQDAAYGSLLRSKRQQLHLRIGMILEERFPETIEAKPELLAHHFKQAGQPERAVPFALRAGDAAMARYAPAEARARYQEALDMARALPPSDQVDRWQIEAVLKLASAASNRREFEADLDNLAQAGALADAGSDRAAVCQVRYWLGRTHYVLGHFDEGVEHAREALELAERMGADDSVTAPPVNLLARLHCLRGEPREAILHARRSTAQMNRLGNRIEEAAVSGVLAFAYGMHGQFEEAFEAADHAVDLAQRVDHVPTLAACLHFCGVVRGWHGDLEVAVPSFEEAITLAEKSGDLFRQYLAHGWRGEAYLHLDRIAPAEVDLGRCLALGDQIGTSFHRGAFEAFLARIRLLQGDVAAALQASERALETAAQAGQDWSRSIALRIRAEVLLERGPPHLQEAEEAVRAAVDIQERRACRFDLAWSRLVLSTVLAARGLRPPAEQAFAAALANYQRMGMAPEAKIARARSAVLDRSEEDCRHDDRESHG